MGRTLNIQGLKVTMALVDKMNAEGLHDQRTWTGEKWSYTNNESTCKTAHCFAGWTPHALGAAGQFVPKGTQYYWIGLRGSSESGDYGTPAVEAEEYLYVLDEDPDWELLESSNELSGYGSTFCRTVGDHRNIIHVSAWAKVKLGLSEYQSNCLFDAPNTILQLRSIVEHFVNGQEY